MKNILDGDCPECRGKLQEINLEHQTLKCRVLCLDCKLCADSDTFGKSYSTLFDECNPERFNKNITN